MGFTVGTKRGTAMMCVIKMMSEDDFVWALCGGNAISNKEVVQPHHNKIKKVDDHLLRKCLVRQGTNNATHAFLDNT